ncbi:MAG TPA: site-specific integrase, partial [Flavobacterium sp.]|nr:site-specific integrase [Flavobacterium sp.]
MAKEVTNQFIKYLKSIRLYSAHTIVAYRSDLMQFKSFIKKDILKIGPMDVKHFLRTLKTLKLSTRSINRKLESLKSFFNFCLRNSLITMSPCASLRQQPVSKNQSDYLSRHKLIPILDNIAATQNRKTLRDRAILELLYFTGCRASEL